MALRFFAPGRRRAESPVPHVQRIDQRNGAGFRSTWREMFCRPESTTRPVTPAFPVLGVRRSRGQCGCQFGFLLVSADVHEVLGVFGVNYLVEGHFACLRRVVISGARRRRRNDNEAGPFWACRARRSRRSRFPEVPLRRRRNQSGSGLEDVHRDQDPCGTGKTGGNCGSTGQLAVAARRDCDKLSVWGEQDDAESQEKPSYRFNASTAAVRQGSVPWSRGSASGRAGS